MKVTIEIEVPETIDLAHAYKAVSDALYLPENVTQAEYDLVTGILDKLVPRKKYEVSRVLSCVEQTTIEASSLEDAIEIAKTTSGIVWERLHDLESDHWEAKAL